MTLRALTFAVALCVASHVSWATSDWDDGWVMMRDRFCKGKKDDPRAKPDANNPTAACYLSFECRGRMKSNAAAGIADGAEMFMVAFALDRKTACRSEIAVADPVKPSDSIEWMDRMNADPRNWGSGAPADPSYVYCATIREQSDATPQKRADCRKVYPKLR